MVHVPDPDSKRASPNRHTNDGSPKKSKSTEAEDVPIWDPIWDELPPLAECRPPPNCRSRFPVALKRAAAAVDEAQLRFADAPLQFEDAFEDAKQRFLDVYEAMSGEKKRALKRAAIQVNMKEIWADTARHDAYYPRRP